MASLWKKKAPAVIERQAGDVPAPIQARPHTTRSRWRDFQADRTIHQNPKPIFRTDSTIATMGSCFANELRAFLIQKGIGQLGPKIPEGALPLMHDASKEESSWGPWDGQSNLQWYNTFSIRQEVERAVGIWPHDPADYWTVSIGGETLYQCPYRRRIFADSPEKLAEITRAIDASVKESLQKAEVVIWTLGLTEVWRKKDNGRFSCAEPGYCMGAGHAETELVPSDYLSNYDNMDNALRLLREHFGQKKVVITVSPVPLGKTFRPDIDIVVANMESKSTLRAVAGRIAAECEEVTYFPAYELCMLDPTTYRPDGRHVARDKVDQIMAFFVASHGTM